MTSSAQPDDADRTRLSRAAVAQRALELADSGGPEALTIRKLATDLGVTPMALYWHFRSKEALLTAVADRIWGEVDVEVDWSAPWTDQLRGMFLSLLSVLRAHPAAPKLLLSSEKLHSEAAMQATETALEVLRRAGFGPADASAVARSALWTALALVLAEPGIEFPDPEARAAELRKHQIELATLPAAKFPRLVECAVPMTMCDDPEEHYAFGVEMFIAGAAAMAAARGRGNPSGEAGAQAG